MNNFQLCEPCPFAEIFESEVYCESEVKEYYMAQEKQPALCVIIDEIKTKPCDKVINPHQGNNRKQVEPKAFADKETFKQNKVMKYNISILIHNQEDVHRYDRNMGRRKSEKKDLGEVIQNEKKKEQDIPDVDV